MFGRTRGMPFVLATVEGHRYDFSSCYTNSHASVTHDKLLLLEQARHELLFGLDFHLETASFNGEFMRGGNLQRIRELTVVVFVVCNCLSSSSDTLVDILDVHREHATSYRHSLSAGEMELLGTSALDGVLYLGGEIGGVGR